MISLSDAAGVPSVADMTEIRIQLSEWRSFASFMATAGELDNGVNEKPGSKPNEHKCPSKEQSENVTRTSLRCLPQNRADHHQRPPKSNYDQEDGPPRHELWAGCPKTEHGERQDYETSETDNEKDIIHGVIDFDLRETFDFAYRKIERRERRLSLSLRFDLNSRA
jgi:hypothetical protein